MPMIGRSLLAFDMAACRITAEGAAHPAMSEFGLQAKRGRSLPTYWRLAPGSAPHQQEQLM
jgi:hypothetical protein